MKSDARSGKVTQVIGTVSRLRSGALPLLLAAGAAAALVACGKPGDSSSDEALTPVSGMTPVFSSKCAGILTDPMPVQLGLWHCPLGVDEISVPSGPPQVILEADCKLATLHTVLPDRQASSWLLPGDMRIELGGLHGGMIELSGDQTNNASTCSATSSLELSGRVNCANPDKPVIQLDKAIWHLNQGQDLTHPGTTRATRARGCQLPPTCTLEVKDVKLNQC